MGDRQKRWFLTEEPVTMDDLGVQYPYFPETSIWFMWVKQCHCHHPPVATIFVGGINLPFPVMGGLWHCFTHQITRIGTIFVWRLCFVSCLHIIHGLLTIVMNIVVTLHSYTRYNPTIVPSPKHCSSSRWTRVLHARKVWCQTLCPFYAQNNVCSTFSPVFF